MSESIQFPKPSGATYTIPDPGDENWGQNVTNFLLAIPNGVVPTSGLFTLTGEVDFGATFGTRMAWVRSEGTNPATVGLVRLSHGDSIDWRNNANSANLPLSVNSSDQLLWNGSIVLVSGGGGTFVSSVQGTANGVLVNGTTGVPTSGALTLTTSQAIGTASSPTFVSLSLLDGTGTNGFIQWSNTANSQHITLRNPASFTSYDLKWPTAQGAANQMMKNDGSGNLAWVDPVISITGTANQVIASGSTGAITLSLPQSIGTGSTVSFLGITDSSLTANRAMITSTGGLLTTSATTSTELGFVSGVTSAIQTQLNSKQATITPANLTDAGTDGIVITGGTGAVLSAASIAQTKSDATHNGYLSSGDWSTFNNKGSGTVTSVTGTANQIAVATGTTTPVLSLPSSIITPGSIQSGGNILFTAPGVNGISGSTGGVSAGAGLVGQVIQNSSTLSTATTSGNFGDVTSVVLTAGNWILHVTVDFRLGAGTVMTQGAIGLSTTSGNSGTGLSYGTTQFGVLPPTSATDASGAMTLYVSISSGATYFLKYQTTWATTAPSVGGSVIAVRVS